MSPFRLPFSFLAPAPDTLLTVIGDIHGCAGLLAQALDAATGQIVCVGDYVDRGPDSAAVLRKLHARPDVLCLKGNHEAMLLDFLNRPSKAGQAWLRHGGDATLKSFDIPVPLDGDAEALTASSAALRAAMGPSLCEWLAALPMHVQFGNVAITHAGADPALPVAKQSEAALLWGDPAFFRKRRRDGIWVVHGHSITTAPRVHAGRIAVDTGAYATGRLSMAHIAAGRPVTFTTLS